MYQYENVLDTSADDLVNSYLEVIVLVIMSSLRIIENHDLSRQRWYGNIIMRPRPTILLTHRLTAIGN